MYGLMKVQNAQKLYQVAYGLFSVIVLVMDDRARKLEIVAYE